ncbi:hypothetical protein HG530_006628 [Fusarium avenaceum]|nr:hypothetical protein HG530_006628 [Fusarium avenaceum]
MTSPVTAPGKCYQNAGPEIETHRELTTLTGSPPLWKQVAARSQQEFSSKLRDLDSTDIDITELSPGRILSSIANPTWSAEQVTRSFVKRAIIAQHVTNPISDMFFEEALERAQGLDESLARTRKAFGILHGLPISVKDVLNLRGYATTMGHVGLADELLDDSVEVLDRLQEIGTVLYCKTNVPQGLISRECANYLFGRNTCPDNTDLSAGGSFIALGGSPLGIGTDIASSIRTPANFNGIYGLCPSYGRLPLYPPQYPKPSYINGVAGPMCRTIDGLEVYTRAVLSTQPWFWDPAIVPMPWNQAAFHDIENRAMTPGGLSFGFIPHDGIARPHPPIQRCMRSTRDSLVAAGHEVIDLLSFFTGDEEMEKTIMAVIGCDGGAGPNALLNRLPEPAHPETVFPRPTDAMSAPDFIEHGKRLLIIRKHFLDKLNATSHLTRSGRPVDVLILPAGCHVAPPHGTMNYYLYEAISNVLDWSCATIPVGRVDPNLDPKHGPDPTYVPMSDADKENWDKYSPEVYANGAVCLQILGQRCTEEKVLACLKVVEDALHR